MDHSTTTSDHARFNDTKERDIKFPARKNGNSRRTASFSSTSSSSCSSKYFPEDSPLSPATPLQFSGRVPFSWEQLPGIPKTPRTDRYGKMKDHDFTFSKVLPLPPPSHGNTMPTSKCFAFEDIGIHRKTSRDPFFAALVECSRDDHDQESRTSSDPFKCGMKASWTCGVTDKFAIVNAYTSCKRTCAISQSIVHLPRSSRMSGYNRISRNPH